MLNSMKVANRIRDYRNKNNLSQEDLAEIIGKPRSSIAQIELGNRKVNIEELVAIANALKIEVTHLLFGVSTKKNTSEVLKEDLSDNKVFFYEKFKNTLLYILERCGGRANIGETVLYKLLYFADFNYFERYNNYLTGATYRKLPHGPVPYEFYDIVNNMIENKELKIIQSQYHGYKQTRYFPLINANLELLKASEKNVIDKVINQLSEYSASEISDYSHGDMPWKQTKEYDDIDYNLVSKRKAPYKNIN